MATILVVDDDQAIRFTLKQLLSKRGHDIVLAESGEAALPHLPDVDLVVTDLAMPGMDGLALPKAAREAAPSLPVILLTAFGDERVAVNAIKAGAYDYIAKPFDNEDFPPYRGARSRGRPAQARESKAACRTRPGKAPDRGEPGHATRVGGRRASRSSGRDGADSRRDRHRERDGRVSSPCARRAREPTHHPFQLCGAA